MTKSKPRLTRTCLPTDLMAVRGGEDAPAKPKVEQKTYYVMKIVDVYITSAG